MYMYGIKNIFMSALPAKLVISHVAKGDRERGGMKWRQNRASHTSDAYAHGEEGREGTAEPVKG